ncbi:hypothetical protein [Chryseobacterium aureum]|uniref:hypothetical protein n=1 Tax=Chryseobacterium aureum TaxID=2497456 RepID=UPI000F894FB6|nr:hypothetical protein [Chryseobacterium aureum]
MKRTYKVTINKKDNGSSEIYSSKTLNEAFAFYNSLNTYDLDETNGVKDEYELAPYIDDELQDWTNDELESIGMPLSQWITKQ